MTKFKMTFTGFVMPVLLLFGSLNLGYANSATKKNQNRFGESGTLQKVIVENGSVTIQLDLNGLNGSTSLVARPVTLHFAAAPNSFFPILVFHDHLLKRPAFAKAILVFLCRGIGRSQVERAKQQKDRHHEPGKSHLKLCHVSP